MENPLSWISKIEPELMMEVSLVLSVRQLHDGQNHSLSDSKTSGFKRLEKEYLETMGLLECLIFPLWQRNKHWLHVTLILMVFEIKSWLPLKCL